ncbi:T9SS type A sorting domain-containing protein [Flavobacterium cerinum]|uniref:T9SS type A sorting domain-containing protein n=1 Tax=Flavobacterium cerinum TaxID=2502784 RepID=A0A3S3QD58_9FLAO|nr:T9SS type A sorting domain-containing protein [Flavobacterium cerinum]RWX00359.1 T9SS type A sorting domain-containing protein [Flavobacterium cerinum]
MKKQLLVGAFMLASFLTAQAQESYSFETSEGFAIGAIDEQNNWGASLAEMVVAADASATNGANVLVVGTTGAGVPVTTPATPRPGVFSPTFTIAGDIEVSYDIKLSSIGENAASFFAAAQAPTAQKATSNVGFFNDGQVGVVATGNDNTLGYFLAGTGEGTAFVPFQTVANQWYNVRIVHNFSATTPNIEVFIDGVSVFIGDVWGATKVEQLVVTTDNLPGSAKIDNIKVKVAGTAGVNENTLTSLSVYPNPANDVVNVTNAENILVNGITVTDLNGRTVKSSKFDGVANAQINISDLASGVYMMTVSSDKGSMTKKIVKN